MGLEDILRQNVEIKDFLKQLVVIHGRALREQELSPQLDKVRNDILICFKDLCRLNDMLVACDGEIREEIDMLRRSEEKLRRLDIREKRIVNQREQWSTEEPAEDSGESNPVSSVYVSSTYRPVLDQYIELIGAQNTSLARDDSLNDEEENNDDVDDDDPKKINKSIPLLEKCRNLNIKDIQKLEQLLKTFVNDQRFIEKELQTQTAKIRYHTEQLDEELEKIKISREKVLIRVGLISSEVKESLTMKFFNFSLNKSNQEKFEMEVSDITNHAIEFIDIKIMSLQDQLTHKKEDSSSLESQKDLWNDCIECVRNLEDQLSSALTNTKNISDSSIKVANWLKEASEYLNDIIDSTSSSLLSEIINNERDVIERAYNELPKTSIKTPLEDNSSFGSISPAKNCSSPPFLVAGKSPPKIGISDHQVKLSSSDNNYELSNIILIKNKSQKGD